MQHVWWWVNNVHGQPHTLTCPEPNPSHQLGAAMHCCPAALSYEERAKAKKMDALRTAVGLFQERLGLTLRRSGGALPMQHVRIRVCSTLASVAHVHLFMRSAIWMWIID